MTDIDLSAADLRRTTVEPLFLLLVAYEFPESDEARAIHYRRMMDLAHYLAAHDVRRVSPGDSLGNKADL